MKNGHKSGSKSALVNKRWRLTKKLGFGSFGDIYHALDEQTGKYLAAKVEVADSKYPQLHLEFKVYRQMAKYNGFPRVYWQGEHMLQTNKQKIRSNVMLMDILGDSLEKLYQDYKTFDIKTVCMIGIQIVNRIQSLHKEGFLHRDIKPDNFLIGCGSKDEKDGSVIHMIDMGLAKLYRDSEGKHIAYRDGKRLTGTPRYASINTHNGVEQSRRDDVESLCYLLIYFLKGRLPWQGLKGLTKVEKYEHIRRKKISTTPKELCEGLPEEFCNFLVYVRKIEFQGEPDYKFLKKLLQLCCQRISTKIDWRFAWQSPHAPIDGKPKAEPVYVIENLSKKFLDRKKSAKAKKTKKKNPTGNKKKQPTKSSPKNVQSTRLKSSKRQGALQGLQLKNSSGKVKKKSSCNVRTNQIKKEKIVAGKPVSNLDFNGLLEAYEHLERDHDSYKNRCHEYQILTTNLKAELEEVRKKYYILEDQVERSGGAFNFKRSAEDYNGGRASKKQRTK